VLHRTELLLVARYGRLGHSLTPVGKATWIDVANGAEQVRWRPRYSAMYQIAAPTTSLVAFAIGLLETAEGTRYEGRRVWDISPVRTLLDIRSSASKDHDHTLCEQRSDSFSDRNPGYAILRSQPWFTRELRTNRKFVISDTPPDVFSNLLINMDRLVGVDVSTPVAVRAGHCGTSCRVLDQAMPRHEPDDFMNTPLVMFLAVRCRNGVSRALS
jgi:hypothetical protein